MLLGRERARSMHPILVGPCKAEYPILSANAAHLFWGKVFESRPTLVNLDSIANSSTKDQSRWQIQVI